MRRSFVGLSAMAEQVIGVNSSGGHQLVFTNKRADRVEILYWEGTNVSENFQRPPLLPTCHAVTDRDHSG